MRSVFILHHSYELEGCDQTKLIGIYSTNEEAEEAIQRLKDKNGFKYRPEAFVITEYELNKDHWTEGYATMTSIQVKDKNNNWMTVKAERFPDNTYQIVEFYDAELLGEFKNLDVVECEERDEEFYAVRLVKKHV